MTDAGRKLIPDGVHNRQEDIPKIEAYFQEVCQREPKFLLWRKSSYPGALGLRTHGRRTRPRIKGGSVREKASSADEAEDIKRFGKNPSTGKMLMTPAGAGRFDLMKPPSERKQEAEDELITELENFLRVNDESTLKKKLNHEELFDKLQKYLEEVQSMQKQLNHKTYGEIIPEPSQRELLNTLKRHYRKSTNREAVISNLLTDRKMLEKLYFDLRKTRGFRSGNVYRPERGSGGFATKDTNRDLLTIDKKNFHVNVQDISKGMDDMSLSSPSETITPTVAEDEEVILKITKSIQTLKIHPDMMKAIEEKLKKIEEESVKSNVKEQQSNKTPKTRRSSLDHDDVSPSVGDTIKRYLKMARKKSVDSDKKDRFKTINYDENLRNIKPKESADGIGNDDGLDKGCQSGESWIKALKDFKMDDSWMACDDCKEVITVCETKEYKIKHGGDSLATSAGPHPKTGLLSSGQLFLSNLFHGLQHTTDKNTVLPTAMQKSKSSTSVGRNLVSKKIWRGRSKSQSRLSTTQPCSWTPLVSKNFLSFSQTLNRP